MMETPRLVLRSFEDTDLDDLYRLRSDESVMHHFPRTNTREECRQALQLAMSFNDRYGYWFGPVIEKQTGKFTGFAGIAEVLFEVPFAPATEIGWSLLPEFWGRGYATEAARAWLDFAFTQAGKEEVVSFAVRGNHRSRAVMERLGMRRDPSRDFDHPSVPPDRPDLKRHVVHAISRQQWLALQEENS